MSATIHLFSGGPGYEPPPHEPTFPVDRTISVVGCVFLAVIVVYGAALTAGVIWALNWFGSLLP